MPHFPKERPGGTPGRFNPQAPKDRPKERRPPQPLVFSLPDRNSVEDLLEAELLEQGLDAFAVGATIGEILEGHV